MPISGSCVTGLWSTSPKDGQTSCKVWLKKKKKKTTGREYNGLTYWVARVSLVFGSGLLLLLLLMLAAVAVSMTCAE